MPTLNQELPVNSLQGAHFRARRVTNGYLVYSLRTGKLQLFNGIGFVMLVLYDQLRDIPAVCKEMAKNYNASPKKITNHLESFINMIKEDYL